MEIAKQVHNVAHVVTDELGSPVLLRVFHAVSDTRKIVMSVRRLIEEANKNKATALWLDSRDYGFLVLVPTKDKIAPVEEALERAGLTKEALLIVGLGPTAATLAQALRERRGSSAAS